MSVEGVDRYTAGRRARWWRAGAIVAGVAVMAGAALGPDFDQREVPPDDAGVWVVQASGERYARVNTTLAEIDTVRQVDRPGGVAQHGADLLVYSANLGAVTAVRPGLAGDIVEGSGAATPSGTRDVAQAGDVVAYRTTNGDVFTGRISDGSAAAPTALDPYAGEAAGEDGEAHRFEAAGVAVAMSGEVAAYSSRERLLATLVPGEATVRLEPAPVGLEAVDVQMAFAGDTSLVWDPAESQLWVEGSDSPLAVPASEGVLQQSSTDGAHAYVADFSGVFEVDLETGAAVRVFGTAGASIGAPARPTEAGGSVAGAWLPSGEGPGTLWSVARGRVPLDYGEQRLGESVDPVIRDNGSRAVVNDAASGWVWTLPDGALVVSSQSWVHEDVTEASSDEQEASPQVIEPRAPVARDDEFGVRAGLQVRLPVLLNDHDANDDLLTIDRASVTGLDPSFGAVSIADDGQALVVTVAAGAAGAATLEYAVTDGTAVGGLLSEPATVTLRVHGEDENSPPAWCGVDGCLRAWPSVEVAAGGSATVDALTGWVDPDGDPIYLASATTEAPAASAVATAGGQVVVAHGDPHAEPLAATVEVTVSDVRGATASRPLIATVQAVPQLSAETFTVEVAAGTQHSIDIVEAVTGAAGPLTVTDATVGGAAMDDVAVRIATDVVGFAFSAADVGTRFVTYTVSDGVSEVTGEVRIDVIDPADAQISTVPLTAFVRAGEDVTIDVMSSVTNPTGTVLVIQDTDERPRPPSVDAQTLEERARYTLHADVVGLSALRITGSASDGRPGLLGTVGYSLSDGAGGIAVGQVTVVLVDTDVAPAPGVVDDAYTVRVGTRADLPVLANDAAAPGTVVALVAGSASVGDGEGLAFTSGRQVRYLAPEAPGVYEFTYDAYAFGYPGQSNRGTVRITVVADGGNVAPTPSDVIARVNAGQTVTIPIATTGQDPDGDRVSLTAVSRAPSAGSAIVSADGGSLVYTAPVSFAGQVDLRFSVTDSRGAVADATARIAVAGGAVAPAPITYTDYVQVQVGADNRVVVEPTANDVDPLGGELTLTGVLPDASPGTEVYTELAARAEVDEDGLVTFGAPEEPTTMAYVYSARTANGSIAYGRIVVKAVREAVPDIPVVDDTVLAFADRGAFATGVDVLTGKVEWATGDVAGLTVAPYGEQPDVTASGRALAGPLPEVSRLVVFEVAGSDFGGDPATTYGFLTVPGVNDFVPRIDEDAEPVRVPEYESVSFDVASMVTVPDGRSLEVDPGSVAAAGARVEGRCAAVAGTTLAYDAGEGAPFADGCQVAVKLDSQDEYVLLTVPIEVEPVDPQPALDSLALEVPPGSDGTLDLARAVTWPSGNVGRAVEFAAVSSTGAAFDVVQSGATLRIHAAAAALPGTVETLTLAVTSHEGVAPATIRLTVGPAPSTLPQGASVVRECRQSEGTFCDITVIGARGEVNPLPEKALALRSVEGADDCPGVTFTPANATQVRASWTADAPGGVCDAVFVVEDAQLRVATGTVSLDFRGYPAAAGSVVQTSYGDGTLTLRVDPGAAASSYPAISGFAVTDGRGTEIRCAADGVCPELTGRVNGEKRTYTATAINAVGASRRSVSTVAWSYRAPSAPTIVSVEPIANGDTGARVRATVRVDDPSTGAVDLRVDGVSVGSLAGAGARTGRVDLDVGTNELGATLVAVPLTWHDLPPGGTATGAGADATYADVHGIGGVDVGGVRITFTGTRATLSFTAQGDGAGSQVRYGYAVSSAGSTPRCRLTEQGDRAVSASIDLGTFVEFRPIEVVVCAQNTYLGEPFGSLTTVPTSNTPVIALDPPAWTPYALEVDGCGDGDPGCTATVAQAPTATLPASAPQGAFLRWTLNGQLHDQAAAPALPLDRVSSLTVAQCVTYELLGTTRVTCSAAQTVTDEQGGASYPFSDPGPLFCTAGTPGTPGQDAVPADPANGIPGAEAVEPIPGIPGSAPTPPTGWIRAEDFTFVATMLDASGAATADPTLYASAVVDITFQNALQGLGTWTRTITCTSP